MKEWIKLSKGYPPIGTTVHIATSKGETGRARWNGDFWEMVDRFRAAMILFWRPEPAHVEA